MALGIDAFQERNLSELLLEIGKKNGARLCVRVLKDGEDKEETISYGELYSRAHSLAAHLAQELNPGDRVLLLFDTSLEFIISFWACVVGGYIAVPTYPPQNERSQERLWKLIQNCECKTLLTTQFFKDKIGIARWFISSLRRLNWVLVDAQKPFADANWEAPSLSRDSVVLLQYTSGSTGFPKGVVISHENIIHNFLMMLKVLDENDTESWRNDSLVSWLPLYHDMGLIGGVIFPVLAGSTATLMSPLFFLQKPVRWLKAISKYQATVSPAPDFGYRYCAQRVKAQDLQNINLKSWTMAVNGAEPVRLNTLKMFSEKFAVCGFDEKSFFPTYGLAEATILVSGGRRSEFPKTFAACKTTLQSENKAKAVQSANNEQMILVSCGSPAWGMSVKVLNPQTGKECLPGEIGEIALSGKNMTRGYWKNESKDVWISVNEIPHLKTGDLGFLNDGEIYITGRSKDLMIIRGRNIYPQDLEMSVEASDQNIRAGCVVAFSSTSQDQENAFILAEVTSEEVSTHKAIAQNIIKALSADHGLNAGVYLLPKGSLLKTSSGKIQRSDNKQHFLAKKFKILWSSGIEES